jgi:hypothetical protein
VPNKAVQILYTPKDAAAGRFAFPEEPQKTEEASDKLFAFPVTSNKATSTADMPPLLATSEVIYHEFLSSLALA